MIVRQDAQTSCLALPCCDTLCFAPPPGIHLRWQGMHASYIRARSRLQGMWDLPVLHQQCTCALAGEACTSWGRRGWEVHRRVLMTSTRCTTIDSPTSCKCVNHLLQCCTSQVLTLLQAVRLSFPGRQVPPFCLLLSGSYTLSFLKAQVRLR